MKAIASFLADQGGKPNGPRLDQTETKKVVLGWLRESSERRRAGRKRDEQRRHIFGHAVVVLLSSRQFRLQMITSARLS